MVTTSEIILAVIIVSLSVVMSIYYYQRKKNPKQDNKPTDNPEIKNYIDRINEITRFKRK
jgi:flagellar basal body-associated protein FliL